MSEDQDQDILSFPKCYQEMKAFCFCIKKIENKLQSIHLYSFRSYQNTDNKDCLDKYNTWKECVDIHY